MAEQQRQRFPTGRRLTKRREFLAVQGEGRRVAGRCFLLFARPAGDGSRNLGVPAPTRFGITVTRKVGNAVTRNRIKRLVRESCRRTVALFPAGHDVVVVARPAAAELAYAEARSELEALARQLARPDRPARSQGSGARR